MRLGELVEADGKMDLAKTAALVAHILMAGAFIRLQVIEGNPFDLALWGTYGGFAIAHDAYNRGTAMLKDRSDKKIQAESVPTTTTVTTTTAQGPTL